jgi:hypothetical protein
MSGALLQLATLGSQDAYLTSDPEITLFKSKYFKHTHFGTETITIPFESSNLNFNTDTFATIGKYGDLISKIVLVIELDAVTDDDVEWGYVNKLGHAIIDEITISINGLEIDKHDSYWLNTYYDLYANKSHDSNYNKMIGNVSSMKKLSKSHSKYQLYIPINFWFTKTSTSMFPICALTDDNFQLNVKLNTADSCINYKGTTEPSTLPTILSSHFLVDYVFLTDEEKKLFTTQSSKYLIEKVQEFRTDISTITSEIELPFDGPCKYLLWQTILKRYENRNSYLSWAHDNDWDKAKDTFAKLLWLSTRENLTFDASDNPIITLSSTITNVNNSLSKVSNGLSLLETLSSKVEGLFLFATVDTIDNTQYNIEATIDNVIILSNSLTFEDISYTISELVADSDDSSTIKSNQLKFLQKNQYNVIEMFNTGNFINRKDNPIIKSSLLLNGKERINERDGVYFNYLIPYYYYKNTPQDGINIYNFALSPIDIQPSGTINFSEVLSKKLKITIGKQNSIDRDYFINFYKSNNDPGTFRAYTLSYNMLVVNPLSTENIVNLTFV